MKIKSILVGRKLRSCSVGLVISCFSLSSQALLLDGKDWRQLTDTTSLSYNDVAGICNAGTGICNGAIGSVDFNGWTWASIGDVASLFKTVTGATAWNGTDFASFSEGGTPSQDINIGGAWMSDLIDGVGDSGGFQPTSQVSFSGLTFKKVEGLTRTLLPVGDVATAIVDRTTIGSGFSFTISNFVSTDRTNESDFFDEFTGMWMYQTTSVPEPSLLALMGIGLLGMGVLRKRN